MGLAWNGITVSMDAVVLIAPGHQRGKRFTVDIERNS
jgi:hypothetical protein